jgi:hypothetical protein
MVNIFDLYQLSFYQVSHYYNHTMTIVGLGQHYNVATDVIYQNSRFRPCFLPFHHFLLYAIPIFNTSNVRFAIFFTIRQCFINVRNVVFWCIKKEFLNIISV